MKFYDFARGTPYLRLTKTDFADFRRFDDVVRFMGLKTAQDVIDIPIDYERAVKQMGRINKAEEYERARRHET